MYITELGKKKTYDSAHNVMFCTRFSVCKIVQKEPAAACIFLSLLS
jgi:hypothetical protein